MYKIFYWLMLIGYFGVSIQTLTFKMKVIGVLLVIVNGLLFWR